MKLKEFTRKKLVLIFLSILTGHIIFAQSSDYSAILISINGEGTLQRGDKELKLIVPTSLMAGDKIILTKGNATALLFSGEELSMKATNNYDIHAIESGTSSLSQLASGESKGQGLLGQPGMAYRIRGEEEVFPIKSKIMDKDNAIIRFSFKESNHNPLSFKLINSKTQETIYSKENITDSTLSLASVDIEEGKTYYWTVTGLPANNPVMGVISTEPPSNQIISNAANDKNSHFEYIESILTLHQNNYYFEAYKLIEDAIKKYPDTEIYQKMKENLLLNN